MSPEARAKLDAMRERNDKERGRKLTEAERLANLRRAIERTCIECGQEVEPWAKCTGCGWTNFP
jgi:hypothetical protein